MAASLDLQLSGHHQNSRPKQHSTTMSYYFAIIGTQDNPLFEYEFGTAKQGGDGIARFPQEARHMNQFIVHSSLDIVEEVQWGSGQMYVYTTAFQALLGADYGVIGISSVSTASTITTFPASSREGVSLPSYLPLRLTLMFCRRQIPPSSLSFPASCDEYHQSQHLHRCEPHVTAN
jgi:hypothetical protein